jgi:hypothetical protein
MNRRLSFLNNHFTDQPTAKAGGKPKGKATSDVWESMGLDRHIRPEVAVKRKATAQMMKSLDLRQDVNDTTMPFWLVP